jgi:thiol-disulfide isomerase/thioredoxin
MNSLKLWRWLGVTFALALFCFGSANAADKTKILPLPKAVSDSVPWFAVREQGGDNAPFTKTHLKQLAQKSDRVALVYFATWCVPCREGIISLVKNKRNLDKHNVKIVLVNVGERDDEAIGKWINSVGASGFKVVLDGFGVMTEGFGLVKESAKMDLPKTLVLDKNMKPLFLFGQEGSDFPSVLWDEN